MPVLTTASATHVREDLANVITTISATETPFLTSIGKAKATAERHQWLSDVLAAPNKDNAAAQGADATDTTLTTPEKIQNFTQIFTKDVRISGTLQAVTTAGTKDELTRQIINKGKEIRRDIEAAAVSGNASVASGTPKMAGAEAFISTNAMHGANGASAGYSVGTGLVAAPVAGTPRAFTEDMLIDALQAAFMEGGSPNKVIAPPSLKRKISTFTGNGTKQQNAKDKTISQAVDIYVSDFATVDLIPHRWMSSTTVIAYDSNLWNLATLRAMEKKKLGDSGDSTKYQLITEVTLECLAEAGNAKIADLNG